MPKVPAGIQQRVSEKTGKVSYGVRVYDASRRSKQRWCGTRKTLAEASALQRAEKDRMPIATDGNRLTVGQGRQLFLAQPLGEGSLRAYTSSTKHVDKAIGHRPIRSITRFEAFQLMIDWPISAGDATRSMFSWFVKEGLIDANPFKDHKRHLPLRRQVIVPTIDDLRALVRASVQVHGTEYGAKFGAMIEFSAFSAMRPSEVFAFEMQQVDQAAGTIRVTKQRMRSGGDGPTKTRRQPLIALTDPARQALARVAPLDPSQTVFVTRMGRRFSESTLHYYWHPVRIAAGLPDLQYYDLRHFCATWLVTHGVLPCDVAVQLGHSDNGELVMKHYLNPNANRARQAIREAFSGLPTFDAPDEAQRDDDDDAAGALVAA